MLSPAHGRRADDETPFMLFVRRVNVRFWHKADIPTDSPNVRYEPCAQSTEATFKMLVKATRAVRLCL